MSHSIRGIQSHLDQLVQWCGENGLLVSPQKSQGLVFSPSNTEAECPQVRVSGEVVPFTKEACYVGMHFSSSGPIFRKHAEIKGEKAKVVTRALLDSKSFLEDLPPSERT